MSGPGPSGAEGAPTPKLDIDRTREQLLALGCAHAAEQLGGVLEGAVAKDVPAHAFLDRLLEAELAGREERRIRTALKLSNLPKGQTLESFDFVLPEIDPPDRFLCGRTPARDRTLAHRDLGHRRLGPRQGDGSAAGPAGRGENAPRREPLGVRTVQLGFSVQ
ncbi:MAG: ATP-binding protein [Pseudomonadota bacterium]